MQAKVARAQLSRELTEHKVKDADGLLTYVKARSADLRKQDEYFQIELQMMKLLSGTEAETRLAKILIGYFPTVDAPMLIPAVEEKVRLFISSPGFKMIPASYQSAARYSLTMMSSITSHTTPQLKVSGMSKLVREIWAQCGFFCIVDVPLLALRAS